jgi:REP element-mobilizing transposase RayT
VARYDADRRHRASIRLTRHDYSRPGTYFVTVCTRDRVCCLATVTEGDSILTAAGAIVNEVWLSIPRRFPSVTLDAFVVMPNHVHGVITVGAQFIAPGQRALSLGEIIRSLKAASARPIRISGEEDFAWQRGYYEQIVGSDRDLQLIREYIEANPARWGQDPENPTVAAGREH